MNDFRYVGSTPTDLEGGRPIAPGEFTGEIDVSEAAPKNQMLLEEGLLIEAPDEATREASAKKAAVVEGSEDLSGTADGQGSTSATTSSDEAKDEPAASAATGATGKTGEGS